LQTNACGQVQLKLKTPWRDSTTHLVMTPTDFMRRLAALVQPDAPAPASDRFAAVNLGTRMSRPGCSRASGATARMIAMCL
jgi:hypothetical protein